MINIIVCGSRNFSDYSVFSTAMDDFLAQFNLSEICLFSGGARGADSFAITYAQERNLQCKIFPALWSRFGKSAGPRRNHWMVTDAHACFALVRLICYAFRAQKGFLQRFTTSPIS